MAGSRSPDAVNAIIVVALARFIGGQPISERRTRLASTGYSIFFAVFYSAVGFAVGDVIRRAGAYPRSGRSG